MAAILEFVEGPTKHARLIERALRLWERTVVRGEPIGSPRDVVNYLRLKLGRLEHEVFYAVWVDNGLRVICVEEMSRGSLGSTAVYAREVVKRALAVNAAGVIFAHNHPAGVAEPSKADENLTLRLRAALELIDVELTDHIIVADAGYTSLKERKLL